MGDGTEIESSPFHIYHRHSHRRCAFLAVCLFFFSFLMKNLCELRSTKPETAEPRLRKSQSQITTNYNRPTQPAKQNKKKKRQQKEEARRP